MLSPKILAKKIKIYSIMINSDSEILEEYGKRNTEVISKDNVEKIRLIIASH